MDKHLISYYIGIFIIFSSHIYMIFNPYQTSSNIIKHSVLNLAGASMIAYYFMYKENFIYF